MNVLPKPNTSRMLLLFNKSFLWKSVISFVSVLLFYKLLFWAWDEIKLRQLSASWSGFEEAEKGCYNLTVVTGLFDIGRGGWWTQGRSYKAYLGHLMKILVLDINLVVFIEPKGVEFVKKIRKGRESRTLIVPMELSDLEYFPLLPRITEIMNSESFRMDNINYEHRLPEATIALYNLVTNSKTSLVQRAIQSDWSHADYYVWLDAGYGHGHADVFPLDGVWCPHHLLRHPDKISFIAFESLSPDRLGEAKILHKQKTAWIAGGLFAGGATAMTRFHRLHREVMKGYMRSGVIDDDQTTFVDCVIRDPDNFRPVRGDWYDLMKPFHR